MNKTQHQRARRDGWTPAHQIRFLEVLARTRSVTSAARAAGMSRESAYRLRRRTGAALFAAAWIQALEGHRFVNFAPVRCRSEALETRANPPKACLEPCRNRR